MEEEQHRQGRVSVRIQHGRQSDIALESYVKCTTHCAGHRSLDCILLIHV